MRRPLVLLALAPRCARAAATESILLVRDRVCDGTGDQAPEGGVVQLSLARGRGAAPG